MVIKYITEAYEHPLFEMYAMSQADEGREKSGVCRGVARIQGEAQGMPLHRNFF